MGTVDVNDTEVRETPSPTAKIIDKLQKGTPLAASNLPIEGFHKIRTASGMVGWVSANNLILQEPPAPPLDAELTQAGISNPTPPEKPAENEKPDPFKRRPSKEKPTKKTYRLRGFFGTDFFVLNGVINNFSNFSQGYHYGGEIVVMFTDGFGWAIRGENIYKSTLLTDSSTNISYRINLKSAPFFTGPEFAVLGNQFSLHLGFLGGYASPTSIQSTIMSGGTVGDSALVSGNHFTVLARANLNWQFSKVMSFFVEVGYRYSTTPSLSASNTAGTAGAVFQSSFPINLSGPEIGAGLAIGF